MTVIAEKTFSGKVCSIFNMTNGLVGCEIAAVDNHGTPHIAPRVIIPMHKVDSLELGNRYMFTIIVQEMDDEARGIAE